MTGWKQGRGSEGLRHARDPALLEHPERDTQMWLVSHFSQQLPRQHPGPPPWLLTTGIQSHQEAVDKQRGLDVYHINNSGDWLKSK